MLSDSERPHRPKRISFTPDQTQAIRDTLLAISVLGIPLDNETPATRDQVDQIVSVCRRQTAPNRQAAKSQNN